MGKDYQSLWNFFGGNVYTKDLFSRKKYWMTVNFFDLKNFLWLFIHSIIVYSFKAIIFIVVYVSLMYIIMLLTL